MEKVEQAVSSFKNGLNCSQALLSAYSEKLGLDKETALKLASCFGGGMGCAGETCGAITGALMVIGLRHGKTGVRQDKAYSVVKEFVERFKERNGASLCRELLRCDISTDEGMKKAQKEGLFTSICPRLVKDAAEIVEGLL
ncbi:MAG: C_GCAxxG_C_C family protein [Deltaproteobacteria bacterium]|nr:C_GCAxxG_C_C family protein [Deltaproteobacteria bacterium]